MNNINFAVGNGFPLEANTLNFMQSDYQNAVKGIAKMVGNMTILAGLEQSGNTLTEGWIVINDELIKFEAGTPTSSFYIQETVSQKANSNGVLIDRYFVRTAKFGTSVGTNYVFADLKRVTGLELLSRAFSSSFAENAIISGCNFSYNSGSGVWAVTPGLACINGEILTVPAYSSQASAYIVKDATFTAKWVTALPSVSFILFNNKGSSQYLSYIQNRLMSPVGEIKMLSNEYATLFDNTGLGLARFHGWAICNGANGTIDFGGRFPMGFDQDNAVGNYGGDSQIEIGINNMPSHNHSGGASGDVPSGDYGLVQRSIAGASVTAASVDANGSGTEPNIKSVPQNILYQGDGEPIEFKPLFVSLLFIQRI